MKFEIQSDEGITLNVELVGLKNLKINQCWRLEFDCPNSEKDLKKLMDKINKPLVMALVGHE
tara:strand:+ start:219 stop:404 length:186 start_codon:yes stop_codon:yes gene_type:complete